MRSIFLNLLFVFLIVSCGDSPFLEKEIYGVDSGNVGLEASKGIYLGIYQITASFDGNIVLYDKNELILIFKNLNKFVDPVGTVSAYLWMPDHGHGSFPISIERISKGIYKLSEIYFTMPGFWNLHFQLKNNDEVISEVKWPITL